MYVVAAFENVFGKLLRKHRNYSAAWIWLLQIGGRWVIACTPIALLDRATGD